MPRTGRERPATHLHFRTRPNSTDGENRHGEKESDTHTSKPLYLCWQARPGPVRTLSAKGSALLLIDVVNDLKFAGSRALIEEAEPMAGRLSAFKRRAVRAGVPVIYVNDNFGQWRSDFRRTVAHCTARSSPGRVVSMRLRPTARDYFVLKPKHSGFYDTTLDTLLENLQISRVIVTGIAGNICVLFTANDAYMRGLRIFAPADCIVSNTPEDNAHALRQIEIVLKGCIVPSTQLRFSGLSK
jgi:nicotinamidase-related amidase